MASTYSSLKIQLMTTGENNTTWGDITNLNLGTAIEEAITGSADVTFASADVTLLLVDSPTSQTARNLRLNLTGTSGGARNLIVPATEKFYIVNNGCADAVTVKNSTGTGISVPAGKTSMVFNNGTNVVDAVNYLSSLTLGSALPASSGGTGITSLGTGVATALGINVGTAGSVIVNGGALGTPSSGTVTNLTGTASININGTVGATTAASGSFTSLAYSTTLTGGTGIVNLGSGQFYKDVSGNVGIGTNSPISNLSVIGSTNPAINLDYYETGTGGAGYMGRRARGTVASPTALLSGDFIASFVGRGYGATAFGATNVGLIAIQAAENFTDTAQGTLISFSTTPTGSIARSERMRIDSAGNVGIGTTNPSFFGRFVVAGAGTVGAVLVGDSTAETKITFTSNTAARISNFSNTALLFDTNNLERMRITAAGDVGIGTSSPATKLHILTPTATDVGVRVANSVSFAELRVDASGNSVLVAPGGTQIFNTNGAERARIDSAGNVGIGTATPLSAANFKFVTVQGGTTGGGYSFYNSAGVEAARLQADTGKFALYNYSATLPTILYTNNIERMRIDSSGNVGIGTTSLSNLFTVSGTSAAGTIRSQTQNLDTGASSVAQHAVYHGSNSTLTMAAGSGYTALISATAVPFVISTTATERMRITSAGDVLIGTTVSPTVSKLYIDSTEARIQSRNSTSGANGYVGAISTNEWRGAWGITSTPVTFGTTDTERMRMTAAGDIGIGTTAPASRLHVESGNITTGRYAASAINFLQRAEGTAGAPTAITTSSILGALVARGYDGATYRDVTSIYSISDGAITSTSSPGALVSYTTPSGSVSPQERMRITSGGDIGIGTSSPSVKLDVQGTATTTIRSRSDTVGIVAAEHAPSGGAISIRSGSGFTAIISTLATDGLLIQTAATTRMTVDSAGNVLVTGVGGLGYGTGSGGAVTQLTSRTTGVTLDKTNGAITMFSAAGSATAATFTVTNSKVAATDVVHVSVKSATNVYLVFVTATAAGSFNITFQTTGGTAVDAPVINFAVIKAVTA